MKTSLKKDDIGFFVPSFKIMGGLEKLSLKLGDELVNHARSVKIFTSFFPSEDITNKYPNLVFIKMDIGLDKESIEIFRDLIHVNNISILIYHGFYPQANRFLSIWKGRSHVPLISVLHNKPYLPNITKAEIKGSLIKKSLKRAFFPLYRFYLKNKSILFYKSIVDISDCTVVLSPKYVRALDNICKTHKRIVCIPNFIAENKDSKIDRIYKDKNKLLFLGRIDEEQKKFSRIISIWESISNIYPNWTLDIVGDGILLEHWKKYCKEKKLRGIKFWGHQNSVERFYQNSDIFLMTSDFEGFPLTLCEAIIHECTPILYNSFEAASDIIPIEAKFLLINHLNEEEYLFHLGKLMSEPQLRNKYNEILKEHIISFLPEKIVPQWISLILSILNNEENNACLRHTSRSDKNGSSCQGVPETSPGV